MKNLELEIASDRCAEAFGSVTSNRYATSDSYRRIDRAIEYMNQNFDKPLKVSELAGIANVSLSHFFSLFKQHMGCSPMDYLTRMRMRHACALLDSSPVRIKEVAIALGYEDAFYFSRVFKSRLNVAPLHYRNLGCELRLEIKERLQPEGKQFFAHGNRVKTAREEVSWGRSGSAVSECSQ